MVGGAVRSDLRIQGAGAVWPWGLGLARAWRINPGKKSRLPASVINTNCCT